MMPDREKYIKVLSKTVKTVKEYNEDAPIKISLECVEDILELLKEQEEVEPIPPTDESDLWKCGNCKHQLFRCTHQRYCDMCGRKVKWE